MSLDLPTPLTATPPEVSGGRRVFLKHEERNELGAFKWRGALPALQRWREQGASVVVTASTGNHGAATAWAARRLGMQAIVYAPGGASHEKIGLIEHMGARIRLVGADFDEAKAEAAAYAARAKLPFFEDGAEPAQYRHRAARRGRRGGRPGGPAPACRSARTSRPGRDWRQHR
jgi:threonine dehydratase